MTTNQDPEKISFIIGAGAVENAWLPILRVFEQDFGFKIDADGANCYFARLVYLMRFYASIPSHDARKHSQIFIEEINKIKSRISEALLLAEKNKEIKARKELKEILHKFVFSDENQSALITTNWDTVIDNAVNDLSESNYPISGSDIQCLHLHGSTRTPNRLYLPSEVVREFYRSQDEDKAMGTLHGTAGRVIGESSRTILYGLSLDPLDAELSQTLAVGWSSTNLKEIIIINPCHRKISHRVKILLDERYPAKIFGYSPSNLDEKFEY